MSDEITLDELHAIAERRGLKLAQDELQKLLPSVNRSRKQAAEVRELLSDSSEPAGAFAAQKSEKA